MQGSVSAAQYLMHLSISQYLMHLSISQSGEAAGLIRADQLPLAAAKRWPMSPGLAMMMIIL